MIRKPERPNARLRKPPLDPNPIPVLSPIISLPIITRETTRRVTRTGKGLRITTDVEVIIGPPVRHWKPPATLTMTSATNRAPPSLAIGWDVGGWNCDDNARSRDALVVLDAQRNRLGHSWRGNLREAINAASSTPEFVVRLLRLCGIHDLTPTGSVTVAIDAPLAFPASLVSLLTTGRITPVSGSSASNSYLYRFTERRLVTPGNVPLSVVKDRIGSQSTKAIHAVMKFAPHVEATGVWSDGGTTRFIETYPAVYRRVTGDRGPKKPDDIADAGVCALIAHCFTSAPETLEAPPKEAPASEGWIWLPKSTVPCCA
jgi:hypothetical protein